MCTLRLPFKRELRKATISAILNDSYEAVKEGGYSQELLDFIDRLLVKDPLERPSVSELIQIPIIRRAVVALVKEFEWSVYDELIDCLIFKDPSFLADLFTFEERVSYFIAHRNDVPCTISEIDLTHNS